MNKSEISKIQGQLINATASGGEKALWNIARGEGRKAEAAQAAIELLTSPFHDVQLIDAIMLATLELVAD